MVNTEAVCCPDQCTNQNQAALFDRLPEPSRPRELSTYRPSADGTVAKCLHTPARSLEVPYSFTVSGKLREDWRWVRALLEDADVQVISRDLPSHRTPTAGLAEDAAEARDAIRACAPPVAAVGWSYGGSVISLAAAGEGSVSRLIYIADISRPAGFPGEDLGWIDADPHVLVHTDGRFVLDNDYWLNEGDGRTFPKEVRRHFRDHPRGLSNPSQRLELNRKRPARRRLQPCSAARGRPCCPRPIASGPKSI